MANIIHLPDFIFNTEFHGVFTEFHRGIPTVK